MFMSNEKSPYLSDPNRLADVISAIQVMSTYKFYKLPFDGWADRISADSSRAGYWQRIFEQHPEFFRLDGQRQKASLVWRRQYPKRFQVDEERVLTKEEFERLDESAKERVSRVRLTPADIKTLVDTAINLHARALEEQKERRWWLPLASAIGGLIGGVVGALIGKL
jgi:hypothetical protein